MICRIYHKTGEKKNPLFQGRQSCLPALLETQTPTPTPRNALLEEFEYQTQNPMQALQNQNLNSFLNNQKQNQDHHQENDLKSLINNPVNQSHLFPINGLIQPSCFSVSPTSRSVTTASTTTTTNKNPSTSSSLLPPMLFKSLLSHQDCTWKEQEQPLTVLKQCKTEANFSHFQAPPSSSDHDNDNHNNYLPSSFIPKNHPNTYHYQNPLLFETDDFGVLGFSDAAADADAATLHEMSISMANFNRAGFQTQLDPLTKLPGESWAPLDA